MILLCACLGDHFALTAVDPNGQERSVNSERISLYSGVSQLSGKQAVGAVVAVGSGGSANHNLLWEGVFSNFSPY